MEINLNPEEKEVLKAAHLAELAGDHIDTAAREAVPHLDDRLYRNLVEGLEELGLAEAALTFSRGEVMGVTRVGEEVARKLLGPPDEEDN